MWRNCFISKMNLSLTLILGFAVMATYARSKDPSCKDLLPSSICRRIGDCQQTNMNILCKGTCNLCGGVVPTRPVTKKPITARTPGVPKTAIPTPEKKTFPPVLTNPTTKQTVTYPTPPLPTSKPTKFHPCGVSNALKSRVIGGTKAVTGAWPWQVNILKHQYSHCGGTLISPTWIVTASHCVIKNRDPSVYSVLVGAVNKKRTEPYRKEHKVSRVIMHPRYNDRTIANDIALMELATPAIFNLAVSPACLPRQGQAVATATKCYITGFGKTTNPGASSSHLMQAILNVVSQSRCSALNTRTMNVKIDSSMLCAGSGGSRPQGGCHGDSGGPFVCSNSAGIFTLHGAVSWGSGTCKSNRAYTVFSRVSEFRDWIDSYVKDLP